jgi:hypothetical protein
VAMQFFIWNGGALHRDKYLAALSELRAKGE